ncbi:uncharacterized protein LOC123534655 [Mercenaria mercenaria]|uniref:uncharacterized protein LOC123534655 n=1 Tax=Mercenaria mercenaria TaxID=6596 RepID=UPI001E1D7200|nr:uncharacterized protein LOC123534655 [Mercenaria mercenaria]XP_045172927.1 uncharacterized protein LOC123534655 [Mercenaria mercenaria]
MENKINIRLHRNEDIKFLLEMTSEEGWSFSEIDCSASLKADPKGLLVAEDETGLPTGFIGLFNMSPNMTYVNVFVVRKDMRGRGIGKKLWAAMLEATKDNILVLDGISDMKEWYKQQGFSYEGYRAIFCQGTISSNETASLQNSYNIVPLSDDIWPALIAYDKQVYPYSRERALQAWFYGADRYSVVALLDKCVVGYVNCHWKSEKKCNIRALNADNDVIAEALLSNLLNNISLGSVVSFNLLGDKPIPKCLPEIKSFKYVHRLFTKGMPGIRSEKIFFPTAHMI